MADAEEKMSKPSPSALPTTSLVNDSGTNAHPLYCRTCGSQFLSAGKAQRVDHERSGRHLDEVCTKTNVSTSFWKIDDMWDFDNFGQSRTVGSAASTDLSDSAHSAAAHGAGPDTVYVVCSDCEQGPVGVKWSASAPKEPYYVSVDLVRYETKEGAPENGALPAGMSAEFVKGLIAQKEEAQAAGAEGEKSAE